VRGTVAGLQSLKTPEGVARLRGIPVAQVLGIDKDKGAEAETTAPAGEAQA